MGIIVDRQRLEQQLTAAVAEVGFCFWGYEFVVVGHRPTLRVYIERLTDHAQALGTKQNEADQRALSPTVDDCSRVSRHLGVLLDVSELIQGSYILEVSSPGIERLLLQAWHYRRYLGQMIKVKLIQLQAGRRQLQGVLQAVTDEAFTLVVEDEIFSIAYDNVQRATNVFIK